MRASAAPSPAGGSAAPRHSLRLLLAAFGDPGHVFPTIALGRALAERGHEVTVETWEERRDAVEGAGLGFTAAEEYRMFPPPDPDSEDGAHAAEAARALLPLLEEMRPHAVVSDILTLAPALAAEKAGVPLATLIPHIYPVVEPGLPFFAIGLQPPRTPLGRGIWRAGTRALNVGLEHGRRDLNRQRERLGLPPLERFHGGISPDLALVGTFPQLEYPRRLAGGGRDHRADDLRGPPSRHRAAARRGAAGAGRAQHRPRLAQPARAHGAGGARRGAGARRRDDQPRAARSRRSRSPPTPSSSTGSATAS